MDIISYALSKKIAAHAVSGVQSMSVNGQTLTINTKDSGVLTMTFPTPKDGVSVADIDVNANNQIVFAMSDGSEFISGKIPTVKGDPGFSPIITENADNTDKIYKLDITTADSTFTTPNLKGADGQGGTGGDSSVTLTQEEYKALTEEQKLNGLYYIYDTKRIYKNGVQYGASEPIPLTMEEYKALKEAGTIDEQQEYLIEADEQGILLDAEDIGYSNAKSGIQANTVQDAIDKIAESSCGEKNVQSDWNETDDTADGFIKNKPTIPDITGLVTETWVNEQGFLTQHQDLSNYATKDEIPTVPSKVSELTNDSNYQTAEQVNSTVTTEIAKVVADSPEDFDTLKEMSDWIAGHEDDASAMNSAISDNKTAITALQTGKADKNEIPTTVDELSDSTNYAKTTDIPTTLPANGGNADTVNNHTVKSDVPENAVFTDTVYDDTEVKESIDELNSNLDVLKKEIFDNTLAKDLFTTKGNTLYRYLDINGNLNQGSADYSVSDFIAINGGKTYRIVNENQVSLYCCFYDSSKAFVLSTTATNKDIFVDSNVAYIRFTYLTNNSENTHLYSHDVGKEVTNINVSLDVLGKCKNLLNPTLQTTTSNGVTCTNNGNGTYTLNGISEYHEIWFNDSSFIVTLPSGTYKLIGTQNQNIITHLWYKDSGESITDMGDGAVFTITETKSFAWDICATSNVGTNYDNIVIKPMITTNINATYDDFVPYTGEGNTLIADVASLNSNLDVLGYGENGAKNLFKDYDVMGSYKIHSETYNGYPIIYSNSAWNGAYQSDLILKSGVTYTISAYVKGNGNACLYGLTTLMNTPIELTDNFERVSFVYTPTKDISSIRIENSTDGGLYISCFQIEEGYTLTQYKPYIPSVKMLAEEVDNVKNDLGASNAGAHNSVYRGKYLGNALTTEQKAQISAGTFNDLYIGDYWTIGGVNYRIAAFDYWLNSGDINCTTHHVVIVPDTCLYDAQMNTTNVTTGAYIGSEMYKTNLAAAKTTIENAFGSANILTHREYLANATKATTDPTYESAGSWYDSTVELMNERMVYGADVYHNVEVNGAIPINYTIGKSQLSLFALEPSRICNSAAWWLRDVVSAAYFAFVHYNGIAAATDSSTSFGVRPAFGIKG